MTTEVVTATPEMSAEEVIELMQSAQVRHLPVLKQGELVGIVSDRDIRKGLGQGTLDDALVSEFMIEQPFTVAADAPVSDAVRVMIGAKIGAVPVLRADRTMCGIVALPDLYAVCLEAFEAVAAASGTH